MCSPQESINFTRSSAVKKQPQDGRAYNKRETISVWKTVLRCLTGRLWSRNLFNKNKRWLQIDIINMHINTEGVLNNNS